MSMRLVVAILAVGALVGMSVAGLQAGVQTAGDQVTVNNETFTPTAGSVTTLEHSDRVKVYYDKQVHVYNDKDTLMQEGEDYVWFDENGTVKTVSGGDLDGEPSAQITYGFSEPTENHFRMVSLLSNIPAAYSYILPALVVVVLLVFVRGG